MGYNSRWAMGELMENTIQDVRFGLRLLSRKPSFAAIIVITLGLSIGANSAIFSFANAILLRSLPYPEADNLVLIYEKNDQAGIPQVFTSYLNYLDWQNQSRSFEEMASFADWTTLVLGGEGEALRLQANYVTPSFFSVLRIQPAHGRLFYPDENLTPNGHPVVILSHGLWQRRFGADPEILGQAISLNDASYNVVGILPADYRDIESADHDTDVWLPLMMSPRALGGNILERRRGRRFAVVARLTPTAGVSSARTEMMSLMAGLEEVYPAANRGFGIKLVSLREHLFGDLRAPLMALLAGALFVLLIGCANVANLLLVRGNERSREIALRLALGAGRGRILSQLMTEGLLLALLGGLLGIVLAKLGVRFLASLNPAALPSYLRVDVDTTVLLATLLLSLLAGVFFSLVPALQVSNIDLRQELADGTTGAGRGRTRARLQSLLVAGEIAAALVLLIGAGLISASFLQLRGAGVGFQTDQLLTLRMDLLGQKYSDQASQRNFGKQILSEIQKVPGAQSVGLWGPGLPGQSMWLTSVVPEEADGSSDEARVIARRHHLSPELLQQLRIPLLRGRDISRNDIENTLLVAVVSQSLAESLWPGQEAVGKRFHQWQRSGADTPWITVIGVASDARHNGRLEPDQINRRDIYYPYFQSPQTELTLLVKADSDAAVLGRPVREAIRNVDASLPVYDIRTMSELLAEEEKGMRFNAFLMLLYALLAVSLAALGIYGVLSYAVTQRRHEFGIRMALGASKGEILKLVLRHGLVLTLSGVATGLLAAWGLSHYLASFLFGIDPAHLVTFMGAAALLTLIALVSCYLPARASTRVEPLEALRYE